jgi:hypothetical protein
VSTPAVEERARPAEVVAGYLAAISMTGSVIAMAYRPVRIAPVAILVALVAAALAGRNSRLPALAVALATIGWLVGMTIAVITSRPLY